MKNTKILITGATGFLGQALLNKAKDLGGKLYPTASEKTKYKDFVIEKMDLTDFEAVKKVITKVKPNIVFHLGALVELARDFNTAQRCIDINIKGTLSLLESLKFCQLKRFIFASTEEVYGKNKIPYEETQSVMPPSPYSISKVASEQFIRLYANDMGFSAISLRIGTMYGPNQPPNRFIPTIINNALGNNNIELTSGAKKRDYIFVNDVVRALILSRKVSLKNKFTILNIGSGVSYSLKELVEKIIKLTNSKSKILFGKIPERILEADEWLMDIRKSFKLLKWQPEISLEEGLKKTIKSFR